MKGHTIKECRKNKHCRRSFRNTRS